jgi:hypothetical protein
MGNTKNLFIILMSLLLIGCLDDDDRPYPATNKPFTVKKIFEAQSPDGKKRLEVTELDDSTSCYTQVCIDFDLGRSGECVYAPDGCNLEIRTFWKDSNTIIIETKKTYKSDQKNSKTQFMGYIVNVEYREH